MSSGLYISASGMLAEDARVDVVANNLANVRTAGFRKDYVTFRQRLAQAGGRLQPTTGLSIDRTTWDREQGPIAVTGRNLDLALRGEGLFAVRREGRVMYTRAGDFGVSPNGLLVTADGLGEVLSNGGEPVDVSQLPRFEVNGRGELVTPNGVAASLAIVEFDNPAALEKVGETLFRDTGLAGARAASPEVVQGALEQSSVEPVREMVAMLEAFRAYEMNAQFVRIQDQMMQRAANDVARLPS